MNPATRLLVLDDDQDVANTIQFIASSHGADVRLTTSAEQFFELVEQWVPTCVLLDLVMPGMDGMEVLRTLAERQCPAEIIVTSGMGTKVLELAQQSATARGLAVRGILPKPFKPPALRALLDDAPAASRVSAGQGPRDFCADDIAGALASDQFILHFQPKIELGAGRTVGFEALVRWQHPEHGLVSPMHFVPLAESAGLIDALTCRVVDLGLGWLASSGLPSDTLLAMNLSADSLHDVHLADRFQERCDTFGVAPSRIVLELTETSAMKNPADAFDTLTRLRIKGFGLAIDDFGTGFSSMVQLARLPFSCIKIDKSFVMSMIRNPESRKIVEATIYLGRGLGLTTTAEGVEDASALQLLAALGCDCAQGFHIGRPMPGDEAVQWRIARGK